MRWQPILGVLAMATLSGSALAEDAAAPNEQTAAKTADGIRKDAKGVTGISPFWEALQAGDRAFVVRSYTVALQKYQEAIQATPHKPIAHFRAGEAALATGDKDAAQASWEAGLRYADKPAMKAKLLFVLADLEERRSATDKAIERWQKYQAFVQTDTTLAAGGTVAVERITRLETWKKLQVDYAAVKERIAARAAAPAK